MPIATHDTITMKELVRCSIHRNVTKAISAHLGAKPQCMMTLVIVLLPAVQFRVMNQSAKDQSHASKNGRNPDFGLPWWLSSKESACNTGAEGDWDSSLGQENTLEEEITTHSSILVWRIPWTEEPGRLHAVGLLRVGHCWSGLAVAVDLANVSYKTYLWLLWPSSHRVVFPSLEPGQIFMIEPKRPYIGFDSHQEKACTVALLFLARQSILWGSLSCRLERTQVDVAGSLCWGPTF